MNVILNSLFRGLHNLSIAAFLCFGMAVSSNSNVSWTVQKLE
jgi:hypothetical protein